VAFPHHAQAIHSLSIFTFRIVGRRRAGEHRPDKDPHGSTGNDRGLLPFCEHVEFDPVRGNGSAARRAVEAAPPPPPPPPPPPRVSGEADGMSVSGRTSVERIIIELDSRRLAKPVSFAARQ
jgi:hypothetical protein